MKIKYNSPIILTFTFISVVVQALATFAPFVREFFISEPSFGSLLNPLSYFKLFSHIAGHGSWEHLTGNFSFILLIGPILEEKYGSQKLLGMILLTAFATSLLNMFLFGDRFLGASGIVFMLIILSSVSNVKDGSIPLTFILITLLYVGTEILNSFNPDNVSQFGHIFGGICGGIFGFLFGKQKEKNVEGKHIV